MGKCKASFLISPPLFRVPTPKSSPKSSFFSNSYPLRNSAILDTGSTVHVFNDIARFSNYRMAPYGDFLWAGDTKVAVLGYGDVSISLNQNRGHNGPTLRLQNVAHCQNFACNLVSFRCLQRRGYWWDTRPEYNCLRRTDNSVVAHLSDKFDQFVLEYLPEGLQKLALYAHRNKLEPKCRIKMSNGDAFLWHRRLGHPGPQALEHLVTSSQGVRLKGPTTAQCDQCGQAKARRKIERKPRFDRSHLKRAERLAIDFHDFEKDQDGFSSLMLITDRYSGLAWDFYLMNRTATTIINTLNWFLEMIQAI